MQVCSGSVATLQIRLLPESIQIAALFAARACNSWWARRRIAGAAPPTPGATLPWTASSCATARREYRGSDSTHVEPVALQPPFRRTRTRPGGRQSIERDAGSPCRSIFDMAPAPDSRTLRSSAASLTAPCCRARSRPIPIRGYRRSGRGADLRMRAGRCSVRYSLRLPPLRFEHATSGPKWLLRQLHGRSSAFPEIRGCRCRSARSRRG